ncbi:3-ketoacyl-CoA synthase 5 [Acorus calamus]|uniref:3-ketoacyl-CoA synthase n=1 Tax=Acorus calamus TaxID=4465 RepID=A0AAV9CX54_ACOCL|nr:3-ketoacyl-CoA synthase 5 [Acorus calamus]
MDATTLSSLTSSLLLHLGWVALATLASLHLLLTWRLRRPRIYLLDSACYKPDSHLRVPFALFEEHARAFNRYHPSNIDFQMKILRKSGLGEETSFPPPVFHIPPDPTLATSREEAESVVFAPVASLFARARIDPSEIDVVVANCSVFCPTPSLADMIVRRFGMRDDVRCYNLSGMGCSAGVIAVGLARDHLRVHADQRALVVSTEILGESLYLGNQQSMLVSNCLFRMGGSAVILSNRASDRSGAKYELLHLVRTHDGARDKSYRCVCVEEDEEGIVGINLSKDLLSAAPSALRANIVQIAPLILPLSEKLRFLWNRLLARRLKSYSSYVPDFTRAVDHFCIHTGGRAVIEELQKKLGLSEEHVEASKMTLHRFGNTSSSSVWYVLGYVEAKGRVKRGDKVWQIGLGSGFKCNSAVWRCVRDVEAAEDGAWSECIHRYPVRLPLYKEQSN